MVRDVPSEWSWEPLSRLGSFHKGRGGSKADDEPVGVPVIRYGQLYTHHCEVIREFCSYVSRDEAKNYTPLRKGDIVFAGSGETADEIGKSAAFLGPEPAVASGDTIIFRPNGGVDPLFLGYATNGRDANAHKSSAGQGSSVVHIYSRDLESLRIPLPPLSEQKKIAAILASVDSAIAATRAVIDHIKRVKKGLLQSLMTRGIGHSRLKTTEIGEIPEHWEVVHLDEVVSTGITYGVVKPGKYLEEGGVPFVRGGDLADSKPLLPPRLRQITEEKSAEYSRTLLRGREVLVSLVGQPGAVAVVPPQLKGANISRAVGLIRLLEMNPEFVAAFISTRRGQRQFLLDAIGSVQRVVNLRDLKRMMIPRPPLEEQHQIVERLRALQDTLQISERIASTWSRLKRGLMRDLLTGRVRVAID